MRPLGYRLAYIGAILIVLLNSWLAYRSLGVFSGSQSWQTHTLQTLTACEQLLAEIRTAESAARGYVLQADPILEKQYSDAVSSIWKSYDELRTQTQDNPSQQQRLPLVRERIQARLTAIEVGVQLRKAQPDAALPPSQLGLMMADQYKYGGFTVAYAISQVEGEERRLLDMRSAQVTLARRSAYTTFGVATLLDLLFLLLAFYLLGKEATARQQIATQSDEIRSLNADLEQRVQERTQELEASNQELEAFSYSVSHDLRAPLRTIDGFSLALYEDFADKLDDEGRDYINRVRNGVQRMGQLIDALLQLSRVTRSDLVLETTDLAELVRSVVGDVRASDPERDVRFEIPSTPVLAQADPRLLRVAFENLLGNAFKFTSKTPGAVIEFGSLLKDGQAVYFIRDNGAGFDMYYVDRLFTAFQRLHGDRDFKGSGIGLATTLRIIRRHKGRIWAEGKENEGATFYFTLGS
ncbi:sensor histidine kinase [Terriglobus tenax]|uniref:sensor histidine kinase n=1 Tax=Terriglobus tenax TaxID=1111115 RepID=UPI0021E0C6B9|nr:sensor histidine kinase [Terriglobus tenax]